MIKQEYKRLCELIERSVTLDVTLEEILKEAVVFFETLRQEFPKADKEEREEMIQMMTHLHSRLQTITKVTAKAAGMTEEELNAFAENPSNFTPEQWQMVQSTRKDLYDSARKFSSELSRGESKSEGPKKKPMTKKARRSVRKDWKKS